MGYDFELDGESAVVHAVADRLSVDGDRVRAALRPGESPGEHLIELDGRTERIFLARDGDVHYVHLRGRVHRVHAIDALERARRAADPSGGDEILRAPMPGTVVEVVVREGDEVEAGALLMTIESMKLQTAITAPHDAHIAEVCQAAGDTFDQGDPLVRFAAEDEDETADDRDAQGDER